MHPAALDRSCMEDRSCMAVISQYATIFCHHANFSPGATKLCNPAQWRSIIGRGILHSLRAAAGSRPKRAGARGKAPAAIARGYQLVVQLVSECVSGTLAGPEIGHGTGHGLTVIVPG